MTLVASHARSSDLSGVQYESDHFGIRYKVRPFLNAPLCTYLRKIGDTANIEEVHDQVTRLARAKYRAIWNFYLTDVERPILRRTEVVIRTVLGSARPSRSAILATEH
jgi:hypothetical protein